VYDAATESLVFRAVVEEAWAYRYVGKEDAYDFLVNVAGLSQSTAARQVWREIPEAGICSFVRLHTIDQINLPRLPGVRARTGIVTHTPTRNWIRMAERM
jgi:hypothetical protein